MPQQSSRPLKPAFLSRQLKEVRPQWWRRHHARVMEAASLSPRLRLISRQRLVQNSVLSRPLRPRVPGTGGLIDSEGQKPEEKAKKGASDVEWQRSHYITRSKVESDP